MCVGGGGSREGKAILLDFLGAEFPHALARLPESIWGLPVRQY